MARVVISADGLFDENNKEEFDANKPRYWDSANHSDESYLRAELWMEDVKDWMLPGRHQVVTMELESAQAILRYREELKMFASLKDSGVDTQLLSQSSGKKGIEMAKKQLKTEKKAEDEEALETMKNPEFLDQHWEMAKEEWPKSKVRSEWWNALMKLEQDIDKVVDQYGRAAFVKLSVRSPKDAVSCLSSTQQIVHSKIEESVKAGIPPEEELSSNIEAIKWAAWRGLRVSTGAEALQLLLRSDRVYLDILQHELFLQKKTNSVEEIRSLFNLNVIVSEFFEGFHPDWEFRGFVSRGVRTGLTAYSPWSYVKQQVEKKDEVLKLIDGVWSQVEERIGKKILDYSVDFAVAPTCKEGECWIIEVNAFLPPLAGSGLYSMHNPKDAALIKDGPFEFRIRDTPVKVEEFTTVRTDEKTGKQTTIVMQPAEPAVMKWAATTREEFKNPSKKSSPSSNAEKSGGCIIS